MVVESVARRRGGQIVEALANVAAGEVTCCWGGDWPGSEPPIFNARLVQPVVARRKG